MSKKRLDRIERRLNELEARLSHRRWETAADINLVGDEFDGQDLWREVTFDYAGYIEENDVYGAGYL